MISRFSNYTVIEAALLQEKSLQGSGRSGRRGKTCTIPDTEGFSGASDRAVNQQLRSNESPIVRNVNRATQRTLPWSAFAFAFASASALRLLCVKVVDSPTAESRFSARSSPVVYFALFNVNFSLPRLEVLADDDEP